MSLGVNLQKQETLFSLWTLSDFNELVLEVVASKNITKILNIHQKLIECVLYLTNTEQIKWEFAGYYLSKRRDPFGDTWVFIANTSQFCIILTLIVDSHVLFITTPDKRPTSVGVSCYFNNDDIENSLIRTHACEVRNLRQAIADVISRNSTENCQN